MTEYGKYTYEIYDIDGEVISGGYVYANNDNNAYDKIEEMIEADYDNFAADGYHNFEIVGFEEE